MTPDERRLLTELFDRIGRTAETRRDGEAESFIADEVRRRPFAPYVMAQTVIVQEQALKGAAARIEELEARVRDLEARQEEGAGTFLGGIGKSLFGEGRTSVPVTGRPAVGRSAQGASVWNRGDVLPSRMPFRGTGAPAGRPGFGGGGFLGSALATAAGVAGGALLFQGLSHLFSDPARAAALDPGLAGLDPETATLGDVLPPPEAPLDAPGFAQPDIQDAGFDAGADDPGFDDGGFDAGDGGDWT